MGGKKLINHAQTNTCTHTKKKGVNQKENLKKFPRIQIRYKVKKKGKRDGRGKGSPPKKVELIREKIKSS